LSSSNIDKVKRLIAKQRVNRRHACTRKAPGQRAEGKKKGRRIAGDRNLLNKLDIILNSQQTARLFFSQTKPVIALDKQILKCQLAPLIYD